MGRLLDLLRASSGEESLSSPLGMWRTNLSLLVDQILDSPFTTSEQVMSLYDLLQVSSGEESLSSNLGRWRQELSKSLDRINDSLCNTGAVGRFATLPAGLKNPECVNVNSEGRYFASTASGLVQNVVAVFNPGGQFEFSFPIPGATPAASSGNGVTFDAAGNLYVANPGSGQVYRFSPPFSPASVPSTTFPITVPAPASFINGVIWDQTGQNLFISDSTQGKIFSLDINTGVVTTVVTDAQLQPCTGAFPPRGANGIDFNADYSKLFIANTGMNRILILDMNTLAITRFVESVFGADGIRFDSNGLLWVAENQGDQIVALDQNGRTVDRRGCFKGIGSDGAVIGLLFPSSLIFKDSQIIVSNFARGVNSTPFPWEPENDVTLFTLANIHVPDIAPLHPMQ